MKRLDVDELVNNVEKDESANREEILAVLSHQIAPVVGATIKALQSPATKELIVNFKKIGASIQAATRLYSAHINQITETLQKVAKIDWKAVFEEQSEALLFAAEHGWFIHADIYLDDIANVQNIKLRGDIEDLDKYFAGLIIRDLPTIRSRLLEHYPERGRILNEALDLHDEGRYLASIPLFIATAEGIGLDITNHSAFNTKQNQPEIAKYFSLNATEEGWDMFVKPVTVKHPLSASRHGRLSRHAVLHGRDYDYGTQMNSLQAISFLASLAWLLERYLAGSKGVPNKVAKKQPALKPVERE